MNYQRTSDSAAGDRTPSIPEVRWWRELAIFSQMIMELAWIVPWYRSLSPGTYLAQPWRVLIFYFIILQINFWISRGMNALNIRSRYRRLILGGSFLLASLLGLRYLLYISEDLTWIGLIQEPIRAFSDVVNLIPDEFIIILITLLVSYRGVAIASQHISPTDMLARFKIGFGMLVLFILMNTILTAEVPGDFLYLFLFSGLIAIGSARMAVAERLRGGTHNPFDRKWVFGMGFAALFVVLISYIAAQVTSLPIFETFIETLSLAGSLLVGLLLLLFAPLILLMVAAMTWLMSRSDLASVFPDVITNLQGMLSELNNFAGQLLSLAGRILPDISVTKPILLWGGLAGFFILGLILLSVRWLVRNYDQIQLDELDSVLEKGDLLKLFQQILLRNIQQLGRRVDEGLRIFRLDRQQAAARIRQIYQELISICQELGVAKSASETPLEFLPRLLELFPDHQAGLERITAAYHKVRYGELPEDLTELRVLEIEWQALQGDAQNRLAKKPSDIHK